MLDKAGLVRQWNPAAHRITGMPALDAIGRPPSFPFPEPGAMLTHKLPNGRWLDVLCTALADGGELVIDFRDVTAAKELEEAKDLFLATTSHELRTPITVVQGFASTLASRWDQLADSERRDAVRVIAERAGSLGRLVEQLLLGSRAGADQLPVSNGPFDLGGSRCAVPSPPSSRCPTSTSWWPTSPRTCRPPAATPWPPTSSSASCSRMPSSTRPTAAPSPSERR